MRRSAHCPGEARRGVRDGHHDRQGARRPIPPRTVPAALQRPGRPAARKDVERGGVHARLARVRPREAPVQAPVRHHPDRQRDRARRHSDDRGVGVRGASGAKTTAAASRRAIEQTVGQSAISLYSLSETSLTWLSFSSPSSAVRREIHS